MKRVAIISLLCISFSIHAYPSQPLLEQAKTHAKTLLASKNVKIALGIGLLLLTATAATVIIIKSRQTPQDLHNPQKSKRAVDLLEEGPGLPYQPITSITFPELSTREAQLEYFRSTINELPTEQFSINLKQLYFRPGILQEVAQSKEGKEMIAIRKTGRLVEKIPTK